jgi:hypothetical protein
METGMKTIPGVYVTGKRVRTNTFESLTGLNLSERIAINGNG